MGALIDILVLLLCARLLGELAERLKLPAAVGELTAGILLAVAMETLFLEFAFLEDLLTSEALDYVATLGIFFLILSAGIEMRPKELTEHSGVALGVAAGGVVVPLIAGTALAWAFLPDSPIKPAQSFMVGVALSVTALPATVKVLSELGQLHSKVGRLVVSAAVFDDIIGLFLLAVLTGYIDTGGTLDLGQVAWLVVKVVAFFAVTMLLGVHVYPHISRRMGTMRAASLEFTALMGVALAYGILAEALDLHWILGAFVAAIYFEPSRVGAQAYNGIRLVSNSLTSGLLGPMFFAYIGLRVELAVVVNVPVFLLILCLVAVVSKAIGAGLPALAAGLTGREVGALSLGMSARGGVEIIVIGIAYELGLFEFTDRSNPIVENLFSALILMAVVTTMAAPFGLRYLLPKTPPSVSSGAG